MNSVCDKMRDYIADMVTGTLSQEDTRLLNQHIEQCPVCRNYAQALKKEDLLLSDLFTNISADMTARQQRVLNAIESLAPSKQLQKGEICSADLTPPKQQFKDEIGYAKASYHLPKQTKTISVWRIIMKSKITKLAAAAAIIVAAFIVLHPFAGGTPTFAQVIQPILNARTAIFDIIVGEESAGGPVIHDMVMGSRIRRTLSNAEGVVSIIDLESSRILVLTSATKEAVYIDLKGLPPIPNYMEQLRNVITKLQQDPEFTVEELGQRDIAGQKLIGFRAKHPKAEIIIWADPKTALPVRIEQIEGQLKTICKNVIFDVPMDESLFSMDVPERYTQKQTALDLQGATEQDFIEGLRIRAEVLGDGLFPEGVAVEDYLKQAPAIGKKMGELGLSEKEQIDLGMKLSRHLLFIRFFKGEGEWHYAGKGVKLGDASIAIFWYRPKDSATYRVIYGDLSVKDVAPNDLPK